MTQRSCFGLVIVAWLAHGTVCADQPIVVKGASPLVGARIEDIRVFVRNEHNEKAIPFQIDEVNARDEFVLEGGIPFTANSDDGVFDTNDELVFMWDAASICGAESQNISKAYRLSIRNEAYERCVYVRVDSDSKSQAPDYSRPITFNSLTSKIVSPAYEYQFNRKEPIILGELKLQGANASEMKTVLQGAQFYAHFALPWYLPNFGLNRDNLMSQIESWRVGPIRAIVAVGVKFKKFLSLFSIHMFSELVFYETSLQIPTKFMLEFDPSRYLRKGTSLAYSISLVQPAKVGGNLPELPGVEAKVAWEQGIKANGQYHLSLDFGSKALAMVVSVDERLADRSLPPFMWRPKLFNTRESLLGKAWPWLQEIQGDVGVVVDTSGLQAGAFDFGLDLRLISKADEGIVADFNNLKVTWSE